MKPQTTQIIFLILIAIAIFLFAFTIKVLLQNKDLIISDPLNYGMRVHNFTSCRCTDAENRIWESTETGFLHKETPANPLQEYMIKHNLTRLNISLQ